MSAKLYNIMVLVGVLLASIGAGLLSVPAGLIVAGVLIIGLTVYGAKLTVGKK